MMLTFAYFWICCFKLWVLEESVDAVIAVATLRVVFALQADSACSVASSFIHCGVESALISVLVTVAF